MMEATRREQTVVAEQAETVKRQRQELDQRDTQLASVSTHAYTVIFMFYCWYVYCVDAGKAGICSRVQSASRQPLFCV